MPWSSIWKGEPLLRLRTSSKYIVLKFRFGCSVGTSKGWKVFWKGTAAVGLRNSRINNCKPWGTSWIVALWPMDFILVFGPVQWYPESSRKNSRCPTILLMFPAFFTNLNSPFSALGRFWPVRIKLFNLGGCVIIIPTLKKSQKRKGGPSLRGRSVFPVGSHPLPNMGSSRMPTRNSHYWSEKDIESFRHHRVIYCSTPLQVSASLQCPNLYPLPGKASPRLFPMQNLSHPGQRFLSQGWRCLGLVLQTSQIHRGLQSATLLPSTECLGKNLALYAIRGYPQSLLRDHRRIIFDFNLYIPQYPESSIAGSRLFISIPIIISCRFNFAMVYITTEDKLRLCLGSHVKAFKHRQAWITPVSLFLTILIVFATSSFHEFILPATTWQAIFVICVVVTGIWSVLSVIKALGSRQKIDHLVNDIKKTSEKIKEGK